MRFVCLFLMSAGAIVAQPFGIGIKGGVPMTDFLNAASNQNFGFVATTDRYVVGPMAELRLPIGLGVEVDALYRHYDYTGTTTTVTSATTVGAWEFPLVGKYRFKTHLPLIRPYVEAGVAWDKLSGLTQTVTSVVSGAIHTSSTSNPAELHKDVTTGFVFGGGAEIKVLLLRIAPEVRFTRWGDQHFLDPNGLLHSNLNQAEFLVGLTF
ncbi:MAG TPA: outer membrane beta-barrel protein [Candidatus Acidoferrales bacterium]|nr:outer membrane beta-barrel protein [Candidatus Acidoferrales bacterium]